MANEEREHFEDMGDDTPAPVWIAPRPITICGIVWIALGGNILLAATVPFIAPKSFSLFSSKSVGLPLLDCCILGLLVPVLVFGLLFLIQGFRMIFGMLEEIVHMAFASVFVGAIILLAGIVFIIQIRNSNDFVGYLWEAFACGIAIVGVGILFMVSGWLVLNKQPLYEKWFGEIHEYQQKKEMLNRPKKTP